MTFIPAYEIVESQETSSAVERSTALVLHGALGSRQNFRGFARKLVQQRPDLRLVLVDVRHHGESQSAPPPDTLLSCAEDLSRLVLHLAQQHPGWGPVRVLIGHSFGGKVMLEYAKACAEATAHAKDTAHSLFTALLPEHAPRQVWVLDSDPGVRESLEDAETVQVIAALRRVSLPVTTVQSFVDALVGQGLSVGVARWLATNLKRSSAGYVWGLNFERLEPLFRDYFTNDRWPFLEQSRFAEGVSEIHLVVAENSDRWTPEMRARAEQLAAQGHVRYHVIPNAGHWLHVDNPEAVLGLLSRAVSAQA